MSESQPPDELVKLPNSIRSIILDSVFTSSGTVDKFIGDAIMATFGTPKPALNPSQDVQNAVRCGPDMRTRLKIFNNMRHAK